MSLPDHKEKFVKEEENEEDKQNNEQKYDDQSENSEEVNSDEGNDQDVSLPDHIDKYNVYDSVILIEEHLHNLYYLRYDYHSLIRNCQLCHRDIKTPFYDCHLCEDYTVHESCGNYSARLPHHINHPFHTSHPLRLTYNITTWCHSCHMMFENAPFYSCNTCGFYLDVPCASPSQQCTSIVKHISHQHSLLLIDNKDDANDDDQAIIKCSACETKLSGSGQVYYGCAPCGFYLDEFCAKFPMEFQHPFHTMHGLLTLRVNSQFNCSVCEMRRAEPGNLSLSCQICVFWLCWKCNIRVKSGNISYEDHEHLLSFVEEAWNDTGGCDGYDSYCRESLVASHSNEFNLTKSSIFKCLDCNFKLHLLCGPLPSTIDFEFHIHPLTLYDSIIEDDSGEYYCDVCETQRDPRIRVYHCEECKYFAHVHCLIVEIVQVLRGELKGVELKALGKDYWSHLAEKGEFVESTSFKLKNLIFDQLTPNEINMVERYYVWDMTLIKDEGGRNSPKEDDDAEIHEALQLSRFDDHKFRSLLNEFQTFYNREKLEMKSSELKLKLVKVEGYLIPCPLVDVLKRSLHDYGDIARASRGSTVLRSFAYFVLCRVLKRMRDTLVKDITKHLLQEWYFHLRFVFDMEFEIDFAVAQFDNLIDAFLGLQAETLEDEVPNKLTKKIDVMQENVDALQGYLKSCKLYQGPSEKSEYMKHCLKKASESRWSHSFDRSFMDRLGSSLPRTRFYDL